MSLNQEVILVVSILLIGIFSSDLYKYLKYSELGEEILQKRKKSLLFVYALSTAGIVIFLSNYYEQTIQSFKSSYATQGEFICKSHTQTIFVSKEKDFLLKGDYFIKDEIVLELGDCIDLQDK